MISTTNFLGGGGVKLWLEGANYVLTETLLVFLFEAVSALLLTSRMYVMYMCSGESGGALGTSV